MGHGVCDHTRLRPRDRAQRTTEKTGIQCQKQHERERLHPILLGTRSLQALCARKDNVPDLDVTVKVA